MSLSARRAWIEIVNDSKLDDNIRRSLSARRAWIEIIGLSYDGLIASVALRKESVDRNIKEDVSYNIKETVALRKESVDRNKGRCASQTAQRPVALRKESVDRNGALPLSGPRAHSSLSARRAWIEIRLSWFFFVVSESLSARRAWIEISDR